MSQDSSSHPDSASHPGQSHVSRMGFPRDSVTQPSSPPVYLTAAFDVPGIDVLYGMSAGTHHGHIYTRDSNPNHTALADSIAALEGAEAGAVFASGMGALGSILLTLLSQGDHLIVANALYGRSLQLVERLRLQLGLTVTVADVSNPATFGAAVTSRTRLALVETVSNPLLEVADIQALATSLGSIPLVVDATFSTPELIRPLSLGASIVFHSASKYLNGHGDLMLGVAAGSANMMKRLTETASLFGQNANPFESWLCQRGLRTLPLRMKQTCDSTRKIADFLASHPAVRRVHYPLLTSHRSFQLASRLYPHGTGGIVSFELNGGGEASVNQFIQHSTSIPFSPTLADARTTISWPAGTSHKFMSAERRAEMGITTELIRLSVGLEPHELLIAELTQVFDRISPKKQM
ncbi:MAG: PLP-dependent transferase [Planctomyces sp.]|nr:PLP-dependent transferase [Planctomyces sp.]